MFSLRRRGSTNRARKFVMRGAADRPLAVAAVSIAAAASLAWLSRRRHRRRLAFTEAHVLAAMLRSGAISSAVLPAGMTVPCWWCHSSPLRLRAALCSSDASPHRPGLHGRPCGLGEGYPRKPPTLRTVEAPQALLEIFLERVARVDRGLNAVVVREFARARARAAAADEALRRGELWGPLHGLPG